MNLDKFSSLYVGKWPNIGYLIKPSGYTFLQVSWGTCLLIQLSVFHIAHYSLYFAI